MVPPLAVGSTARKHQLYLCSPLPSFNEQQKNLYGIIKPSIDLTINEQQIHILKKRVLPIFTILGPCTLSFPIIPITAFIPQRSTLGCQNLQIYQVPIPLSSHSSRISIRGSHNVPMIWCHPYFTLNQMISWIHFRNIRSQDTFIKFPYHFPWSGEEGFQNLHNRLYI